MSARARLIRSIRRTLEHRASDLGRNLRAGLEELALRAEEELALEAAPARTDEEGAISLLRLDCDELERTVRALRYISLGRFGCCERCGATIPDAQLVASPLATCCPGCGCGRATDRIPA